MKRTLSLILSVMLVAMCFIALPVNAEEVARRHDIVYARTFTKAPTIDGVVTEAEWGAPSRANIKDDGSYGFTFSQRITSDTLGLWASEKADPNQSFDLWIRWDKSNFYLAIKTPDKKHINIHAADAEKQGLIWNGDAIQFVFDYDGNSTMQGLDFPNNKTWGSNTNNIAFAVSTDGKTQSKYGWSGPFAAANNGQNTKSVIKNDGSYTTYEISIPWNELIKEEFLSKVKADSIFGMTIGVVGTNDEETGLYQSWLSWGDGMFSPMENKYRVGSNKVVLSATDALSKDADPVFPTYTVTFQSDDGTVIAKQVVDKGDSAAAPSNPKKDGYKFASWDKGFSNITADTTVTAQWNKIHIVTFVDHDASELKVQKVENGKKAMAPKNPKRDGYTFTGWDVDFSVVTSDMTVVAQYEKIEEAPPATEPSTGAPETSAPATGTTTPDPKPAEGGNNTMIIVIIAVVAVALVAVVVLVVVKKKKQ